MYFLLNMGIFQPAMLVYQGVDLFDVFFSITSFGSPKNLFEKTHFRLANYKKVNPGVSFFVIPWERSHIPLPFFFGTLESMMIFRISNGYVSFLRVYPLVN